MVIGQIKNTVLPVNNGVIPASRVQLYERYDWQVNYVTKGFIPVQL
ncbi:hypothetical protein IHO13_04005 [Wolbachia endosymbiont of Mansonella perstans]|nr:hypothetical protein [Wolbachia endosymbiont of Mansonella perstans]